MKSKILLFGPLVPPYNGQSVAFSMVASSLEWNDAIIINTTKYKSKILSTLFSILKTVYVFGFCKFSKIYITTTRSNLGFLKDFPILLLGRLSNKVIINHLHGADFKLFYHQSGLLKPVINFLYKSIEVSIVLIEGMESEYSDFPNMKIKHIHNCYSKDFDIFTFKSKKKKQLLYLSNLMKSKGILEFLDACIILLKKDPNITVNIAGIFIGDNHMDCKTIEKFFFIKFDIMKNLFGDRIIFIGPISGIEKVNLLFESSIFVLPSYYESEAFPISIIEAMRAGNAIVVTNHNYLPKIINSRNGVIVEPKSVGELVYGIENILNDSFKLKSMQEHNMEYARLNYTQEKFVSQVNEVIFHA